MSQEHPDVRQYALFIQIDALHFRLVDGSVDRTPQSVFQGVDWRDQVNQGSLDRRKPVASLNQSPHHQRAGRCG